MEVAMVTQLQQCSEINVLLLPSRGYRVKLHPQVLLIFFNVRSCVVLHHCKNQTNVKSAQP